MVTTRKGDFEFASDHNGGTLFSDPAADSGDVTINSGKRWTSPPQARPRSALRTPSGNTGELVLDNSKAFTGSIVGFTGDGTVSNSDLIDVADVNIADAAMNKTTYADHGNGTGTLTLYGANGQALDSINFAGTYQLANFTIESDGDGGTLIVDPPVNTNGQASPNTQMASNQNPTGTAATDGFAFNFSGPNHAPTTDFHPDLDTSGWAARCRPICTPPRMPFPTRVISRSLWEARATIISASPVSPGRSSTAPTSISCERCLLPCTGRLVILVVNRAVALLMADLTVLLQPDLPA